MAKEMMIVFVYDTQRCTSEADDPADAVLYFHPGWVSDTQRHALCGQVVGVAHCVKSLISQPLAITLQSGKFLIREYGRYILAIGSDRNIPDWVLQNRAGLLTSMIKVYHGDLATIAAQFPGDNNPRFSEKLYQMLETYLPVLQYGCHIFQRVPMLSLPKSATSIYMEAMQILEHCQRIKGVLGGVVLYNNKIVASQLPPSLTSHLAVVDPYRIKSPAETCETDVPLPLGAQLLLVYVARNTHDALRRQAERMQQFSCDGEDMISKFRKNQEADREKSSREFPATGMKRDKSLLFTAVPEEDHNLISPPNSTDQPNTLLNVEKRRESTMPDVVPFTNRPRPRPNKLTLSFKTQASLDEEGKENTDQVFAGQTSVCSTPMVEYKRLHGHVQSICQNPDGQPNDATDNVKVNTEPDIVKNVDKSAKLNVKESEKKDNKILLELNCIGDHYINKPESVRKLGSVNDIQETIKRFSNRASAKFRLKKKAPRDDTSPSPEKKLDRINMTINDPLFPVFRNDGVAISESLFNQYLEQHYSNMNQQDMSKAENMFTFNMKVCEQEKIEGFDSELLRSPQRTPKKVSKESVKKTDQARRKSLSLPLKSLTDSSDSQLGSDSVSDISGLIGKKKPSGVQLTPLMEKLSHLAFSDKSSGYSSRVMTPMELKEFPTPSIEKNVSFCDKPKSLKPDSESEPEAEDDLDILPEFTRHSVKSALFISGLQNMALMVLMELEAANDSEIINMLWETSLNTLGPIEQKCMEPLPTSSESTDYSYLTLDPDWGTVKKGGPWASLDIATMGLMHNEFAANPDISEIILRSEESVVLGTSCGGAQVYYAEGGARRPGPPAPSDSMATVQLKAKRRLHRDHSVVIL